MKEAGCNVMRIAEFAWSRMEPEEGRYDFDCLHTVVDKLGAAGIATFMCTPTCTLPQWLADRYPDILFVRLALSGPMKHGSRRHACPNSPVYRAHCKRIVTKMAEEFGQDNRIIVVEHENRPATLALPGKMTDLITRKVHTGTVALKPYAVMVLSA